MEMSESHTVGNDRRIGYGRCEVGLVSYYSCSRKDENINGTFGTAMEEEFMLDYANRGPKTIPRA